MLTLSICGIEPAADLQKTLVSFSKGGTFDEEFSYPTARRVMKAMGFKEQARVLKKQVTDLANRIQEIQEKQRIAQINSDCIVEQQKELQSTVDILKTKNIEYLCNSTVSALSQEIPQNVIEKLELASQAFPRTNLIESLEAKQEELFSLNVTENRRLQEEILGSEVKAIKLTFQDKNVLNYSFYQYLCELTAREKGQVYKTPTAQEFLRHAAKSLAKFEEPYKKEEFMITRRGLMDLYEELRGIQYSQFSRTLSCHPDKINQFSRDLTNYISEEAGKEVTMTIMTAQEVDKSSIEMTPFKVYFILQIGDQTRILMYHSGTDPFRFL